VEKAVASEPQRGAAHADHATDKLSPKDANADHATVKPNPRDGNADHVTVKPNPRAAADHVRALQISVAKVPLRDQTLRNCSTSSTPIATDN